jgi:hypothetical protein
MGDQPDLTPEQRIRAAVEHTVEMAGKWLEEITTIRPEPSGPVDVPVCAPCAAEVMAQPQ